MYFKCKNDELSEGGIILSSPKYILSLNCNMACVETQNIDEIIQKMCINIQWKRFNSKFILQ